MIFGRLVCSLWQIVIMRFFYLANNLRTGYFG